MTQEMSSQEIQQFLKDRGHGVLVFSSDDPYGIPMSFGIADGRIITQLMSTSYSQKKQLLDGNKSVSLIAYEVNNPFDWRSVVIDGELSEMDGNPTEQEIEVFATDASTVDLSVFNSSDDSELESTWYRLNIDAISAYKSPTQ